MARPHGKRRAKITEPFSAEALAWLETHPLRDPDRDQYRAELRQARAARRKEQRDAARLAILQGNRLP